MSIKKNTNSFNKSSNVCSDVVKYVDCKYRILDETNKELERKIKKRSDELFQIQTAIINILEDVEDQRAFAFKQQKELDAILNSIGDGLFVVDKNLKIIEFNPAAEQISGYLREDVLGENYKDILRFEYSDTGRLNDDFITKALETGETQDMGYMTELVTKDNRKIPVADSSSPIKDQFGNVHGCVVVFRDITHEREIDRTKTEFVSLASHQLRTPLATMGWYTEMLLDGDAGEITKEQREYLREIFIGNKRLVALVNALLNVSRLELGTFCVEPELCNIIEIMKDAIGEIQKDIHSKEIKIITKFPKDLPKINVDKKLTHIIFLNLISNAVKYTPKKGKVTVEISKKNKNIQIKVSDTGMGIPKEQQFRIFQKLFRADNAKASDTQGTGLGLYIVKSILDSTGGGIWFDSKKNKGTSFYVIIPETGMKKKQGEKFLEKEVHDYMRREEE